MHSSVENFAAGMKRIGALIFTAIFLLQTASPAGAQWNNNALLQQQRMQQQQQAAQRQQEQMRRQQQMQQQQQAQMQRQQQMQAQQQRMQQQQQQMQRQQQTQAQQQRMQQQQATQRQQQTPQRYQATSPRNTAANNNTRYSAPIAGANPSRSVPTTAIKGQANRNVGASEGRGFVSSAGIAKLTRPLTPGEIRKGFTGKVLGDGRPLIKFQGRVFAVPAGSISGLVRKPSAQSQMVGSTSRWNAQQKVVMNARLRALTAQNAVVVNNRLNAQQSLATNARLRALSAQKVAAAGGGSRGGGGPGGPRLPANDNRALATTQSRAAPAPLSLTKTDYSSASSRHVSIAATVPGDPKAIVRMDFRGKGAVEVTHIERGNLPKGSGGTLLAQAIRESGEDQPKEIVFKSVVNEPTISAYRAGQSGENTVLGQTAAAAAQELGLKPVDYKFENHGNGKVDLIVSLR